MSLLKDAPVRKKIMFISFFVAGIAALLSSILMAGIKLYTQRTILLNELAFQSQIIGRNSSAAILFNDYKTAEENLLSLKINPKVMYGVIYNKDNSVFASFSREGVRSKNIIPPSFNKDDYRFGIDHLTVTQQILVGNERVGTIYVSYSLKELYFSIILDILVIVVIIIISLFIVFLFLSKLQYMITKPIVDLAGLMHKISRDKNYSLRALVQNKDEIGILAAGFNEMLTEIQRRDIELEKHSKYLEEQVGKRTEALSGINEKLATELAERKKAEEMLLQTQFLVDHASDSIFWVRPDGGLVYVNEASCRSLGYSREELLAMFIDDLDHCLSAEEKKSMWKTAKKLGTVIFESYQSTKDGRVFPVEIIGNYLNFNEKEYCVLFARDITERRKAEEELLKMNKIESVGVLAGGIAHDFNNILAAILGNVSMAKMFTIPENNKVYEKLSDAEKAIFRAKDLTQQLLTFSKGGVPIKKTMSIEVILTDSARFALTGSPVRCGFDFSDDLYPVDIDGGLMHQVINNLVINAEQAMPQGGIITIRTVNLVFNEKTLISGIQLEKGKYIRISIEDHGIGIQKEHLDKIFDPYFTTKQRGSGIGLATTYSIIKKHEGYITVDSTPGKGTIFDIYLKASEKRVETKAEDSRNPIHGKGRILLMDDEEIVADTTGEILIALGYDVKSAKDGKEAIDQYNKARESGNPFDVVILDLTVPGGMGGKEAIKKLLEMDPYVKAIVSSGYSNDPIMGEFRKYGFSGIAPKPYHMQELSKVINEVMCKKI